MLIAPHPSVITKKITFGCCQISLGEEIHLHLGATIFLFLHARRHAQECSFQFVSELEKNTTIHEHEMNKLIMQHHTIEYCIVMKIIYSITQKNEWILDSGPRYLHIFPTSFSREKQKQIQKLQQKIGTTVRLDIDLAN